MGKSLEKEIIGKKFNRLTAIKVDSRTKKGEAKYLCRCECGNIVTTPTARNLKTGITKSCGCLQKEKTKEVTIKNNIKYKNYKNKEEYNIYCGMKNRCYKISNPSYPIYGGKGIKVCDRWLESFDNFFKDMGARPFKNAQVDRIDSNKDYSPENCRWTTPHENVLNRKFHDMCGITKHKNKKIEDKYQLRLVRFGTTRTSYKTTDIELLKEIREQWLEEFEANQKEYVENTLKNKYRKN